MLLKTKKSTLRGIRNLHSKNMSGAKDLEKHFEGHKKPTLEESKWC
jgi:hypothetical protein